MTSKKSLTIDDLPFVTPASRGKPPNFWDIRSIPDTPAGYEEGCDYGHDLALMLMRYQPTSQTGGGSLAYLITIIARDQAERGVNGYGDSGVLVGFWELIGQLVKVPPGAADRYEAGIAKARERRTQEKAASAKVRSDRARHAALAGAVKRREAKARSASLEGGVSHDVR